MTVSSAWVRSFVILARTQHFGRAAEELFISVAALSQQIARLERDVGVALFERTSRSVRITAEGLELLPLAEASVDADARIGAWKKSLSERSNAFQIGFVSIGSPAFVSQLLSRFGADGAEIRLRHFAQRDIVTAVDSGEIDVAFVWGRIPPTAGERVIADHAKRTVLVPAGHRLAGRASISLDEIDGERLLRSSSLDDEAQRWWAVDPRPSGRRVEYGPSTAGLEEALALVAMGEGLHMTLSWVAHYFGHFGVSAVEINDLPDVPFYVCFRPGTSVPRMDRFRDVLSGVTERQGR